MAGPTIDVHEHLWPGEPVDGRLGIGGGGGGWVSVAKPRVGRMAAFWAGVTGGTPAPAGEVVFLPPAGPDGFAMFCQPWRGPAPTESRSTST